MSKLPAAGKPRPPMGSWDVVQKVDALQDMEEIEMGRLNLIDHMGLQIRVTGRDSWHGIITEVLHGNMFTHIKARWNGSLLECRNDPRMVVRVESIPPRPRDDQPSSRELIGCEGLSARDSPEEVEASE